MKKVFETSTELKRRFMMTVAFAILMGIFCFAFGTYAIYGKADLAVGIAFIFIGLLQFSWAWVTFSLVKAVKLVTTPEKLEFYSPGLELSTTWDNLERIGRMAAKNTKYDSLLLRNPAKQKTSILFRLFRKQPEKEIPLSMFSNWRTSEMGQEIKKFAPHLFSDGGASK